MADCGDPRVADPFEACKHVRGAEEWEGRVPRLEIAFRPFHELFKRRVGNMRLGVVGDFVRLPQLLLAAIS